MIAKRDPFVSFLVIFCLLIFSSYLFTYLLSAFDHNADSSVTRFLFAVGQVSLTSIDGIVIRPNFSLAFMIFSPMLTQLCGIVYLSILLWFYWQLFSVNVPTRSFKNALKVTTKISILIVAGLFLFFLYVHPSSIESITWTDKILASLSLAVGSFNNAGFLNSAAFPHRDALLSDSIIQIGVIAGTTFGNLGTFVIDELFNPRHLRHRLAHPEMDWSMMTKVLVFGTASFVAFFSALYWLTENAGAFADVNIMESLIASFYEISVSRGFGWASDAGTGSTSIFEYLTSLFAAGPFSTGGGLTLISLVFVVGIFYPRFTQQRDFRIAHQIARRLIAFTLVCMLILSGIMILLRTDNSISSLLLDQWKAFSCNGLDSSASDSWGEAIFMSLTNIFGRIGFVVACYLTLRSSAK